MSQFKPISDADIAAYVSVYKTFNALWDDLPTNVRDWYDDMVARAQNYNDDTSDFGSKQLAPHLRETDDFLTRFYKFKNANIVLSQIFGKAMSMHDIGKSHDLYNAHGGPGFWTLKNRPTAEQKHERDRHAARGFQMMVDGIDSAHHDHPFVRLMMAVALLHHERCDRSGPQGLDLSALPEYLQRCTFCDIISGDMIYREHQKSQRTVAEALQRMCNDRKYDGQLPAHHLEDFALFCKQELI